MLEKLGKKLYTVREAADLIGIAVCTVRLMGYDGRLPKVRIGKRIYFEEEGIRAYLSGQAKPDTGPKQGTANLIKHVLTHADNTRRKIEEVANHPFYDKADDDTLNQIKQWVQNAKQLSIAHMEKVEMGESTDERLNALLQLERQILRAADNVLEVVRQEAEARRIESNNAALEAEKKAYYESN